MSNGKVVFITGCSSGLGKSLAIKLFEEGYIVIATARNVENMKDIKSSSKLYLDIESEASIKEAVETVINEYGKIDILINNAGIGQLGSIEDVNSEMLRKVFDINVFGTMSITRKVLPYMRQQGSGTIVNISSILGKLVIPLIGTYSASKFALEALSDALRMEVKKFGIKVILIEPGTIKSNFDKVSKFRGKDFIKSPESPYKDDYEKYMKIRENFNKNASEPDRIAGLILKILNKKSPKSRCAVPRKVAVVSVLSKIFNSEFLNKFIK